VVVEMIEVLTVLAVSELVMLVAVALDVIVVECSTTIVHEVSPGCSSRKKSSGWLQYRQPKPSEDGESQFQSKRTEQSVSASHISWASSKEPTQLWQSSRPLLARFGPSTYKTPSVTVAKVVVWKVVVEEKVVEVVVNATKLHAWVFEPTSIISWIVPLQ
jgi:hypothetical protein